MAIPIILGAAAAIAAAGGIGSGIHGAVKMSEANDTMQAANARHKRNLERFKSTEKASTESMDSLGKLELEIMKSFEDFSNTIEKIQNRPEFKTYDKKGVSLPKYDGEKLKEVYIGAGVLLGGIGGATAGTFTGIAAGGATTAAVMAFGAASTGTPIALLSGAAATNATLAFLGGGALAAGGGGMALGSLVLGGATLGVGLLVGGIVFNITGSTLSDKADEAWNQMKRAEREIDTACVYMDSLKSAAVQYASVLRTVKARYDETFSVVSRTVNMYGITDWNRFSDEAKLATENTVLLVGLLYKMCQVNLVEKSESKDISNINHEGIRQSLSDCKNIMREQFGIETKTYAEEQ